MLETSYEVMRRQGITRRSFLKFCSLTAASLGLGEAGAQEIAKALQTKPRTPVIWLHGLECTCCTESFIRSAHPLAKDVVLSMISLDYDDTLMAAAGHQAEEALEQTISKYKGNYILAVEGNPPLADDGIYCIPGGRPFVEKLKHVAKDAKAIISWGSCASWGCVQAAKPNPTQAVPVHKVIFDKPIIKVPGCPPIAEVMTGVVTYVLTFDRLPEMDAQGRPKMFYSVRVHDKCYRRPNFDAGQFVERFDGALERRAQLPDPVGPRLHRLLGRRLLGQGLVLRPSDDDPPAGRRGRRHRRHGNTLRRRCTRSDRRGARGARRRQRDQAGAQFRAQ
jgi:hydrogenase small subunit